MSLIDYSPCSMASILLNSMIAGEQNGLLALQVTMFSVRVVVKLGCSRPFLLTLLYIPPV